jgi:hypothetical protein
MGSLIKELLRLVRSKVVPPKGRCNYPRPLLWSFLSASIQSAMEAV